MKTKSEDILKWFTGKSREKAEHALFLLIESEAEGQWIPKASRSVRAAFGKHNVATKAVRELFEVLKDMRPKRKGDEYGFAGPGYSIAMAMQYGNIGSLVHVDMPKLQKHAVTDEQKAAFELAQSYYDSFIEVAKLMGDLDNTRPAPVFTSIGVSRTITKTLEDAKLDLDTRTIRVCPHERYRVKVWREDKKGNKYQRWETHIRLLWPKNTKFNASRFASSFTHCHSCGHAIHNPFNWCPILIDNKAGVPHALWVGRDCAQTVFGIKVTGDVEIEGGKPK